MAEKNEKKPSAKPPAAAAKPPATVAKSATKTAATPSAGEGQERCQVAKCKQPVRAKGMCQKHYLGWRRGDVGKKHRYNTCSKEGCRKPATVAGRCEEHKKGAEAASA